tara:strand:- start:8 stop:145 length:138 start_codon:yes stop_codon:yes gene_type:complete
MGVFRKPREAEKLKKTRASEMHLQQKDGLRVACDTPIARLSFSAN